MRQDFLLSVLIHLVVVMAMVAAAPFKPQVRTDLGDVIKVNLASFPTSLQSSPTLPSLGAGIMEDEPIAAILEPATVKKAKPIDKPKPKPKKKETKPKPQAKTTDSTKAGSPVGQKDVSDNLGAGSRFGGASIDNASFDYPYWFVQAFSKIERNWSNPVYANQPLACIIYFQVIRSGRIIKIEIEQSSGFDAYDRACERAVKMAEPLPPLPKEFTDEIIGIHLEFPYSPQ